MAEARRFTAKATGPTGEVTRAGKPKTLNETSQLPDLEENQSQLAIRLRYLSVTDRQILSKQASVLTSKGISLINWTIMSRLYLVLFC